LKTSKPETYTSVLVTTATTDAKSRCSYLVEERICTDTDYDTVHKAYEPLKLFRIVEFAVPAEVTNQGGHYSFVRERLDNEDTDQYRSKAKGYEAGDVPFRSHGIDARVQCTLRSLFPTLQPVPPHRPCLQRQIACFL
jgi:hypothetical protein